MPPGGWNVTAVEPVREHVELLHASRLLNSAAPRLRVVHAAAAAAGGSVDFAEITGNTAACAIEKGFSRPLRA